jgi:protease-4
VIAQGRGVTPQQVAGWIDAAPLQPDAARTLGLVDELCEADELDARLSTWTGRRKVEAHGAEQAAGHAPAFGPGPEIAVLHIEGTMSDGESLELPLVGSKLAGSKTLTAQIEALREDKRVKAVVVRIDSPGGSVSCADAIARELELTAREKPVVISMGNVAASGGYYVATAGQYIFSDALTRTGSIGIFRPKVDLSGTLKLFGVGVDELSLGANAGLYSWLKPYSPRSARRRSRGSRPRIRSSSSGWRGRERWPPPMSTAWLADGSGAGCGRRRSASSTRTAACGRRCCTRARWRGWGRGTARCATIRGRRRWSTRSRRVRAAAALTAGAGVGVPAGAPGELVDGALLWVLRRLPASLWLTASPEALALSEEVMTLE